MLHHCYYIQLNGGIIMIQQSASPSVKTKKTYFPTARIRAAFFILFFTLVIMICGLIFRQNTAAADTVPLAELLGYQVVELEDKQETEPVKVAVEGKSISQQETIVIAKELQTEYKQDVVVYAIAQPIKETTPASYHEEVTVKVTIKDEIIEVISFEVYKDVHPGVVGTHWDLSDNVLDLVTGKVTVQIEMDEQLSKKDILAKAQALSKKILANNQESGVATVFLNIQVGDHTYGFYSENFHTLGSYQLTAL